MKMDAAYWNDRYKTGSTGWDIGYPSTPIKEYIDQLENKKLRILIPGAGNAYEGEYLHQQGFDEVYIMDIAPEAFEGIRNRVPSFPEDHLMLEDFFSHKSKYDLIIEQTFFCALDPSLRPRHAKHCAELLKPGGKLVGLLFDDPLYTDHPPFGGNKEEYIPFFEPYFNFTVFERAYNSIPPRVGRELFVLFERRSL